MRAISPKRSPKKPIDRFRTLSPGDSVFTTAASIAPVPEAVSTYTSLSVSKTLRIPSLTRYSSSSNCGPRWLIIWPDIASSTSPGTGMGPGILRFNSPLHTNSFHSYHSPSSDPDYVARLQ